MDRWELHRVLFDCILWDGSIVFFLNRMPTIYTTVTYLMNNNCVPEIRDRVREGKGRNGGTALPKWRKVAENGCAPGTKAKDPSRSKDIRVQGSDLRCLSPTERFARCCERDMSGHVEADQTRASNEILRNIVLSCRFKNEDLPKVARRRWTREVFNLLQTTFFSLIRIAKRWSNRRFRHLHNSFQRVEKESGGTMLDSINKSLVLLPRRNIYY